MAPRSSDPSHKTILIVGASRGLGLAMVAEYLRHGWRVIGTVRGYPDRTGLHELADGGAGRLEVETVDITAPDDVAALRERLAGRVLDTLFVNAGVTNDDRDTIGTVTTPEFVRVMVTNALSPMRVVEAFEALVPDTGLIGVMSSGQGSVANNETGRHEVYRGSKAALNTFMRSFAARQSGRPRAMILMAPGWVRTDLGGPEARLGIEDSVPNLVNVLLDAPETPGLRYIDYLGRPVPW